MITSLALLLASPSLAQDLVIDDEVVPLSGEHTFRTVLITNLGRLIVPEYNPETGEGGTLVINADAFILQQGSAVTLTGRGHPASNPESEGPGAGEFGTEGGGGGAHAGGGGRGVMSDGETADGQGGEGYATLSPSTVTMGSAGGGTGLGGIGGVGGGAIVINARTVQIQGVIHANGMAGDSGADGAGGGGGGGGVLIRADELDCTGAINANGGLGGVHRGATGGGGGGGIVLQYHDRPGRPCTNVDTNGAISLGTWTDGEDGIQYLGEVDWDGDGLTWAEGDCQSGIADAFPGAAEICNDIDDNCDGQIDEDCVFEDTGSDVPESWELGGGSRCGCTTQSQGLLAAWIPLMAVFLRRRRHR